MFLGGRCSSINLLIVSEISTSIFSRNFGNSSYMNLPPSASFKSVNVCFRRFWGKTFIETFVGNMMFLYLPHLIWREKYLTSSNGISSSESGLFQDSANIIVPAVELFTDNTILHSSLTNFNLCFVLSSRTSSAKANNGKIGAHFAIGMSYQPAFLSWRDSFNKFLKISTSASWELFNLKLGSFFWASINAIRIGSIALTTLPVERDITSTEKKLGFLFGLKWKM